jgi:hypothetical protein
VNTRGPSKTLSSQFLADFQEDYWKNGRNIFEWMRAHRPDKYFDALVSLAKVHKLELGQPGDFDEPQTREEALDRLEQRAGPKARKMLEKFLAKVEALDAAEAQRVNES